MSSRRVLLAAAVALLAGIAVTVALTVSAGGNGDDARTARADAWIALRPATLERTEVAAARVRRFIYVVGGFEARKQGTTAAVERYDIERNRWRRVRSMPVGLNHPAAAAYRGDVYVLGGYTGRGSLAGEVASLYRYDPERNRWSRLPGAPTKRAALAVGVIGNKLYAAGGANAANRALKTLEIYDFKRGRWTRGPDMETAREHLAGAVAGRPPAFYVLAGRAAGRGNFSIAERYLPSKRRWERLPDMLKARGGIAAAAVDERVVVFGGEESSGTIEEVEIYDPDTRRWSPLPDLRTPRHGLGGVSRGRRVYAIEGGPTPGFDFSSALEALDIVPARVAAGG
jgi:N-acetylneuraminic acid mutarotase